jgi:hypothetical protein
MSSFGPTLKRIDVVASRVVLFEQIGCIEERIERSGFCSTTNFSAIIKPLLHN